MQSQKGQSLLEVMVVLMITVLVLVALLTVVVVSLRNAQFAQNQTKATKYAQDAIERIKTLRDRNDSLETNNTVVMQSSPDTHKFSDLWSDKLSNLCAAGTEISGPCYFKIVENSITHAVILTQVDPNVWDDLGDGLKRQIILTDKRSIEPNVDKYKYEKELTVRVEWIDASGTHQSDLQTILKKLQ